MALARALIKRPKVLLLDEPLSALDRKLREEMRLELVRLQQEVGITFVIVTHDQEEALSMANRIAVMDQGRLLQVAPPPELYESPNCRMVADFIGKMNLFPGRVLAANQDTVRLQALGMGEIRLPHGHVALGPVEVAVRPEKVSLTREAPGDGLISATGKIAQIAYFGDYSHVYVQTGQGVSVTCYRSHERRHDSDALRVGDPCWVSWAPGDCILLTD